MQTIHIKVNDNYANRIINMLENLKGIMLEDIKVEKNIAKTEDSSINLIKSQETIMAKTWKNKEDEAWDEL